MRNPKFWEPTNIIYGEKGWEPNRAHVAPWSTHVTNLESIAYPDVLTENVKGDLLDVGAGTVPYYGVYKDLVQSVTTLDWSASSHDDLHIDVVANANEGLPFNDSSFDTVLLADVMEHIKKPEKIFHDINRVLRNNGITIVFVPFMYGLHEEPHDYHRYTKHSLENLCQENSLNVVELMPFGGGPDVVIDLIEKMAYGNKIARTMGKIATRTFVKTKSYKSLQDKFQDRFPIGYTLVAQKINLVTQ